MKIKFHTMQVTVKVVCKSGISSEASLPVCPITCITQLVSWCGCLVPVVIMC